MRRILNRRELREGIASPDVWEEELADNDPCNHNTNLDCWVREADEARFDADLDRLFNGEWAEGCGWGNGNNGDEDGDIVNGWVHRFVAFNDGGKGIRQGYGPMRCLDYVVPGNGQPYPPTARCTTLGELMKFLQGQPRPANARIVSGNGKELQVTWKLFDHDDIRIYFTETDN